MSLNGITFKEYAMVLRLGCGFFSSQTFIQKRICCSSLQRVSSIGQNSLKQTQLESKSWPELKKRNMSPKQKLSFEEFKKTHIKSFEKFASSSTTEILYGKDLEAIKEAYKEFSEVLYSTYQLDGQGNPLHVL